MDIEKEIESLKKIIESQQQEIEFLKNKVEEFGGELNVIDEEMNRPGKTDKPSLFEIKRMFRFRDIGPDGFRRFGQRI